MHSEWRQLSKIYMLPSTDRVLEVISYTPSSAQKYPSCFWILAKELVFATLFLTLFEMN